MYRLTLDLDTELKRHGKIDMEKFQPSELLELLAQAVEQSQRFHQGAWYIPMGDFYSGVRAAPTYTDLVSERAPKCGSAACVAGHGATIFKGFNLGDSSVQCSLKGIPLLECADYTMGKRLGLTQNETNDLFSGYAGSDLGSPDSRTVQDYQVGQLRAHSQRLRALGR